MNNSKIKKVDKRRYRRIDQRYYCKWYKTAHAIFRQSKYFCKCTPTALICFSIPALCTLVHTHKSSALVCLKFEPKVSANIHFSGHTTSNISRGLI